MNRNLTQRGPPCAGYPREQRRTEEGCFTRADAQLYICRMNGAHS
jgi:hypothetical protein